VWELPGRGFGGFKTPQLMSSTPLVVLLCLSWGSEITPTDHITNTYLQSYSTSYRTLSLLSTIRTLLKCYYLVAISYQYYKKVRRMPVAVAVLSRAGLTSNHSTHVHMARLSKLSHCNDCIWAIYNWNYNGLTIRKWNCLSWYTAGNARDTLQYSGWNTIIAMSQLITI